MQKKNSHLISEYIHETYHRVKDLALSPTTNTTKNAVLVEPRPELHIETDFTIKNVLHFLGEEWGLYIFYGNKNKDFIEENYSIEGVKLINLNVPNLTADSHNALVASHEFWNQIASEKALIFQTDSFLCRSGIEEFMQYDYVGAPWHSSFAHNTIDFSGGNGGLSLRTKSAMLHCLDNYPYRAGIPEDIYFCHCLYQSNSHHVAPRSVAQSFSVESIAHPNPLGVHRPDRWLDEVEITAILNNISYENL